MTTSSTSTTTTTTTSTTTAPSTTTSPATTTTPAITTPAITTTPAPTTTSPKKDSFFSGFSELFSKSNMILLLWFLAIYFIVFFILGIFFNKNKGENGGENGGILRIVRIFDGIVFLFLFLFMISVFSNLKKEDIGPNISNILNDFKDFGENPYSIVSMIAFFCVFYGIIYLIRLPMDSQSKPLSIMLIETIAIVLFVIIIIVDFFKYILKIDLLELLIGSLTDWIERIEPTPSPSPTAVPIRGEQGNEVFNIRNNLYTYDEAKSVCSLYGSQLADYDQIEKAYNDGGEWCNYGWSEGQMALFPTQKGTWNKLQKTDKAKNACGRPGINGGFIRNKNVRFGVNCYGKKPKPNDNEKNLMNANIEDKYPDSAEDKALRKKTEIWKKFSDKFLILNSFNKKEWSDFSS